MRERASDAILAGHLQELSPPRRDKRQAVDQRRTMTADLGTFPKPTRRATIDLCGLTLQFGKWVRGLGRFKS